MIIRIAVDRDYRCQTLARNLNLVVVLATHSRRQPARDREI